MQPVAVLCFTFISSSSLSLLFLFKNFFIEELHRSCLFSSVIMRAIFQTYIFTALCTTKGTRKILHKKLIAWQDTLAYLLSSSMFDKQKCCCASSNVSRMSENSHILQFSDKFLSFQGKSKHKIILDYSFDVFL